MQVFLFLHFTQMIFVHTVLLVILFTYCIMEISNLTAKYYSTGRINPNLVVLKLVCTLESLGEPMKSVSYLPETDLIGLGCDLNFEIKKKKKIPI